MRQNPIKAKLRAGEPTIGTWLSLGDLYATRVLARLGWDWLTLDMEHQPLDWAGAAAIFRRDCRCRRGAALPGARGDAFLHQARS